MMEKHKRDPEWMGDLLGYQLGLADEQARARIESAFATPADLQSVCDRLQRCLAPLDADGVELPRDLNKSILDRIEKTKSLEFPAAKANENGGNRKPLLTLRELASLAAAVLLFVGIFIPGYRQARMAAQKVACANNLQLIGNGHVAYGEMNDSQWPYAGSAPEGTPWYREGARNSRHVYQMIPLGLVSASAFVCPGSEGDRVMQTEHPEDYADFPDIRNCSYTTNFLTGPWYRQMLRPDDVISADLTPLVDRSRRLIVGRWVPLNSQSHGGFGQTVLRADISVRFHTSPRVGVENDDIYRVIGVEDYNGFERPRQRSDAFLIP